MSTSTPYFYNRSPYVSNDTAKVDKLWEDLYDCKHTWWDEVVRPHLRRAADPGRPRVLAGLISVVSPNEASKLLNKTRAAPKAPDLYLVQLQVFHDLHCLNLIRQWVYMDVYPDQAEWVDGRLNHDTTNALHVGK